MCVCLIYRSELISSTLGSLIQKKISLRWPFMSLALWIKALTLDYPFLLAPEALRPRGETQPPSDGRCCTRWQGTIFQNPCRFPQL